MGTIKMQKPSFKKRGLDLTHYKNGTLNISINPYVFTMKKPEYTFLNVEWTSQHPPEHFSFSRCKVEFEGVAYDGWVYYPHPETKERHFQDPSIIEIIADKIPGIKDGDQVKVMLSLREISLNQKAGSVYISGS
jgi:CTP-dependent riboflavin kinase